MTKSCLYKTEVKWCGKIINGSGVKHDPERIQGLQSLPYPSNAGELQQFLCSTNWMCDSLVDYARLTRPLQDALDTALATAVKRTKRVASGIPIALTVQERAAYDSVTESLATSATLAFPKPDAVMCLLTDASDLGWAVIVLQVPTWKANVLVHEQLMSYSSVWVEHLLGRRRTGVLSRRKHTQSSWRATSIC